MISLIVGKLGVGKTYNATRMVFYDLREGNDCYVNWAIDFKEYLIKRETTLSFVFASWLRKVFRRPRPTFGRLFYYNKLSDVYGISNGCVYMDEAHADLFSRNWEKIPPDFVRKVSQSRHYHMNLVFITQHQGMVDLIVRRLVNEVIEIKKYWFLFYLKYYDGQYVDKISDPINPPKKIASSFWLFSRALAGCYDTFALLGTPFTSYEPREIWNYEAFQEWKDDLLQGLTLKKLLSITLKGGEKNESSSPRIEASGVQERKSVNGSQSLESR